MEEQESTESSKIIKSIYFSKIHKKIQNKYDEMHKKIEKSRSLDSLHNLFGDIHLNGKNDEIYCTAKDSVRSVAVDKEVTFEKLSEDEVEFKDAFAEEIDIYFKEATTNIIISEIQEIDEDSLSDCQSTISRTDSKVSLEEYKEGIETSQTPTSSPKISLRDRIGLKISKAKEKRRIKQRERDIANENNKGTRDKVEKFILSNTDRQDLFVKHTKKKKNATVSLALIEVTGLDEVVVDEKIQKSYYCRFRLGSEKCKAKSVKIKNDKVSWLELFNISMFEDNVLEITLWENKDTFVGKCSLDVSLLEKDKTHRKHLNLEENPHIELFLLVTVTGTSLVDTVVDVNEYNENQKRADDISKNFVWYNLQGDDSIGFLSVIVYGAKGLHGQDCYCVLELDNDRVQTHTEYKTCDPNWMKVFTFSITDITSILEITIHDEKKSEDIGKISIALLNINNGEKKWHALKDNNQRERAKGNNPRIFLEMRVSWNLIKASIRVINPKEQKYLDLSKEKLDRHIFARNLTRIKAVVSWILDALVVLKTCFEWESTKTNIFALSIWLLFCWSFRTWMLPLLFILPFVWYRPDEWGFVIWRRQLSNDIRDVAHVDGEEYKQEEKTSLRQKIQSLQEMVLYVQNAIGEVASFGESVKNLYNFTVPFLSCLAIFIILTIATVIYLIPIQYMFMAWSIHKFTRKILRPNRIPNNEILDLLSRVPDDETLLNCKELPLEEPEDMAI